MPKTSNSKIFSSTSLAEASATQENMAKAAASTVKVGDYVINPMYQFLHSDGEHQQLLYLYIFDPVKGTSILDARSENVVTNMFIARKSEADRMENELGRAFFVPVKTVALIENGKQSDKKYLRPDTVYTPATEGGNPMALFGHNEKLDKDGRYYEPFVLKCKEVVPTLSASYDSSESAKKNNAGQSLLRTRQVSYPDGSRETICVTTVRNTAIFEKLTLEDFMRETEHFDDLFPTTEAALATAFGAEAAETLGTYWCKEV